MKKKLLIILSLIVSISFVSHASQMDFDSSSFGTSDDDDWSDGPPGGDQSSGISTATLIDPATLAPSSTNNSTMSTGPTNHPFADLYTSLVSMNNLLLYSTDIYWNASDSPSSSTSTCTFSNLPSSLTSIMQGSMGNYFGTIAIPGSLPLQIAQFIKNNLITYVKGMTEQLNLSYYANTNGNDFINFVECQLNTNPGTFAGNLAYVDTLWNTTSSILDTIYQKLQSSQKFNNLTLKFFKKNIQSIQDAYLIQRYQLIINWYTSLVKQLAQRFNPTLFEKGLYSLTIVPNTAALTGYSNAFIDACNKLSQYYDSLTTTPISYTVDNFTLSLNQTHSAASSTTVFTTPSSFFSMLQSDIFSKIGDICAYVTSVSLARATKRVQNISIPSVTTPSSFSYDTLTDVPTFLTSTQTGSLPPLTCFPGTQLPTSPEFYCAQQLFNSLSGYVSGAIASFHFNTYLPEELFIYDNLSSTVLSSYESEGLDAPKKMLNDLKLNISTHSSLLHNLHQRIANSTSSKVASTTSTSLISTDLNAVTDVFQELIIACNGSLDTQYWYNNSLNLATTTTNTTHINALATYSNQSKILQDCVSSWNAACKLLATASSQPQSSLNQLYSKAGDLFYSTGSSFLALNLLPLNAYALTLGAYLKVTAYQTLMGYYASYYKESFTTYNHYLQTPPSYSYNKGVYSFDVVPGYEKYLFTIIYDVDQAISASIQNYETQLSFFLSQKKDDPSYLPLIWPLQDALLLLTNFQEAITPLLLEQPCALASDNKSAFICGNDYQLLQVTETTVSEEDIAPLLIKAHNTYLQSYPLFLTLDKIMNKYSPTSDAYKTLQEYTRLDDIFQLSENKLNFSQFFLLHQARLYTSVAQRLIEGKPFFWQKGDPQKPHGSPYALLLYAYAAAIYQHLGPNYAKHAQVVNAMKYLNFPASEISAFKQTITTTLQQTFTGKTSQEIDQIFQQLNALSTILYLSPNDNTQFTFLQLLSRTITDPGSTPDLTTFKGCGYADWLAASTDSTAHSHLKAALYYYQGYLIATQRKDIHAQAFLKAAQTQFDTFTQILENLFQQHHITDISQLLNQSFANSSAVDKELTLIKNLILLKDNYQSTMLQMSFLATVFAPSLKNLTTLNISKTKTPVAYNFLEGSLNLPGIIADIYQAFGDKNLRTLQQSASTTLNKDLTSQFTSVINYYTTAKNYYGIASTTDSIYQQKFLDAQHALSDTYAYQSYTSIIPLYTLQIPTLTLSFKSSTPLPSLTSTTVTLDQALKTFTMGSPVYLNKHSSQQVPSSLAQQMTSSSSNAATLINKIATPLYLSNLSSQVKGVVSSDTLSNYSEMYKKNYIDICSQGVTVEKQLLKGALTYNSATKTLTSSYSPLPALDRFTNETSTAVSYYTNSCAKLYANSASPFKYENQLLIPSNNSAGQDLTNQALLNTYLSRALELMAQIAHLKQDKKFLFLQKATPAELLKLNFYDTLPLYKQLQPLYENLIALYIATNSFVSQHGLSASICSKIIAQLIIEWMQTNRSFLCGTPDITTYRALLHNLAQGTEQIKTYAHQIQEGETYISQAALIFGSAYEYCAQAFALTPDTPLSTTNPDTNDMYPNPATTSLPQLMKWKEAGTYYEYAGDFLTQVINEKNNQMLSAQTQQSLLKQAQDYFNKAITNYLQYSTYHAALFCSYAFQECRCPINQDGSYKTVTVKSNNAQYPIWDYPLTGAIPHTKPTAFYTYPVCETNPKNGSTYSPTLPDTVYQGVASMEIPHFAFVKNQCLQGQPSSYTSMYNTMQQIFLNALYYYNQVTTLIKNNLPTTKISPTAQKQRQQEISKAITAWIIKIFNKNPGFYDPYTKKGSNLPSIVIPVTSADMLVLKGKDTRVTQFVDLITCADLPLSLANPRRFYMHTLRYWSSRSDFYETLLDGLLQWCKPGNYDIAGTLLNDVITMFNSIFIHTYLPSLKLSDAEYQVTQMVQNSQQDNTGSSAGYF